MLDERRDLKEEFGWVIVDPGRVAAVTQRRARESVLLQQSSKGAAVLVGLARSLHDIAVVLVHHLPDILSFKALNRAMFGAARLFRNRLFESSQRILPPGSNIDCPRVNLSAGRTQPPCLAKTLNHSRIRQLKRLICSVGLNTQATYSTLGRSLRAMSFGPGSHFGEGLVRERVAEPTLIRGNQASVKLFAALARNEKLEPDLKPIRYDDLVKGLTEAASDHELLARLSHTR